LERIDVVNSGVETGIAHEAMRSFWEGRSDYREAVIFDQTFWESLTAESAFLIRSFNDFCRVQNEGKYEDLVEEKMPEVTALAFFLGKYLEDLLQRKKTSKESGEANDEDAAEQEFIVEQLLHIAMTLDYSDEVGRRKMFSLLRESLAVPELPEECTKLVVETLRCACGADSAGESEFCSVVLEAIAEVHDTIITDDSFVSAKSEISDDASSRHRSETPGDDGEEVPFNKEEAKAKIIKEIVVNMKCLHIAQCMLQNVQGHLQQNMNLVTMLNNLVVPAVRSHEAPIRERGLLCLGLCCLLDKVS
jgi:condensin complex subunit 3